MEPILTNAGMTPRYTGTLMAYSKWGENIGIPWHSSEDDVRRLREVGLLEWIYYVKPGTPPRD